MLLSSLKMLANFKWFAPLLLLCFLLPVNPATVEAGLYPVIDHPLYGVRLGEHYPTLSHDIRKDGKQITRDLNIKNSMHSHGRVWSIKGALNNSRGIDRTRFYMLGKQVYEIEVIFKSHSNRKFNHLKNNLIDSYGEYEIDATGGALFETHIDGQNVSIRLNRTGNSDSGDFEITLQYLYKRFVRDVRRLHRRKMPLISQTNSFSAR